VAVLDDEPDVATSLCACLRRQGLSAEAFFDSDALWSAMQGRHFDAFVLDWTLADGTSEALVRSLRNDPGACSAPIFILTATPCFGGVPSIPQLARAVEQYALHCRSKPFSCATLGRQLCEALSMGGVSSPFATPG
jgi:DNA-binding NtrC family response regulator